jgi:hypothetical protein
MLLPSIIKDNFLSEHEIDFAEKFILNQNHVYDDIIDNEHRSYYYTWNYYNRDSAALREIFDSKIQNLIGSNIIIDHSHILSSTVPYDVHTDYFQVRNFKKLNPAYTLIIPLQTCDSHTIAFKQSSQLKEFNWFMSKENPPITNSIDSITRDQYLSHVRSEYIPYLDIKEIFKWNKGSVYACDRQYFHCSDNYHKNNLSGKRAFVFWTSMPC